MIHTFSEAFKTCLVRSCRLLIQAGPNPPQSVLNQVSSLLSKAHAETFSCFLALAATDLLAPAFRRYGYTSRTVKIFDVTIRFEIPRLAVQTPQGNWETHVFLCGFIVPYGRQLILTQDLDWLLEEDSQNIESSCTDQAFPSAGPFLFMKWTLLFFPLVRAHAPFKPLLPSDGLPARPKWRFRRIFTFFT